MGRESLRIYLSFFESHRAAAISFKIIAFFPCSFYLLPLNPFNSEMFCDCCPQPHPAHSCLPPPQKTHKHIHYHECVYTPAHKNMSRENRNSCRLWAKKIRGAAAVWVRCSSAPSFQLSDSLGERVWEKPQQSTESSGFLNVYCYLWCSYDTPCQNFAQLLASYKDPPERCCLWRSVKKRQTQHFETLKGK